MLYCRLRVESGHVTRKRTLVVAKFNEQKTLAMNWQNLQKGRSITIGVFKVATYWLIILSLIHVPLPNCDK